MKKAVIFDLDGTLLYTLGDIAGAVNRALAAYQLPEIPVEIYREMVGYGLKDVTRQALERTSGTDTVPLVNVYETVLAEYRHHPAEETVLYPGISKMLNMLAEADIPVSILSNKEDPLVQIIVDYFFPHRQFITVQGRVPGVPAKPSPQAVFSICSAMKADYAGTFFVGDSGADMQTAGNAGITGIGVSWGYQDTQLLKREGARYIAFSPEDIVQFIKGEQS